VGCGVERYRMTASLPGVIETDQQGQRWQAEAVAYAAGAGLQWQREPSVWNLQRHRICTIDAVGNRAIGMRCGTALELTRPNGHGDSLVVPVTVQILDMQVGHDLPDRVGSHRCIDLLKARIALRLVASAAHL